MQKRKNPAVHIGLIAVVGLILTSAIFLFKSPAPAGEAVYVPSQPSDIAGQPVNVKDFKYAGGAKGDGVADDTAAINAAATAANTAGGGLVYLPRGTYIVNPATAKLILYSNVTYAGDGRGSVIKVAATAGSYLTVFGQPTEGTLVTNVGIQDLTIDQNTAANTTANIHSDGLGGGNANDVVRLVNVTGVRIQRVRFDTCSAVNTLFITSGSGAMTADDLLISDNFFRFRQGSTTQRVNGNAYYDNSAAYTEALHARIEHNTFAVDESTQAYQLNRANGAIEVHAPIATINANIVDGYQCFLHMVTPYADGPNRDISDWTVTGNTVTRGVCGMDLIAAKTATNANAFIRGVSITGNVFDLKQKTQDRDIAYGIGFAGAVAGLAIEDLVIEGNTIRFEAGDTRTTSGFTGGTLSLQNSGIYCSPSACDVNNITIANNKILNAPAIGISVGPGTGGIRRAHVRGNSLTDCGTNPNVTTPTNRCAIGIGIGTTGPMEDIVVEHNHVIDTGSGSLNGLNSIVAVGAGTTKGCRVGPNHVRNSTGLAFPTVIDSTRYDGDFVALGSGLVAITTGSAITPTAQHPRLRVRAGPTANVTGVTIGNGQMPMQDLIFVSETSFSVTFTGANIIGTQSLAAFGTLHLIWSEVNGGWYKL